MEKESIKFSVYNHVFEFENDIYGYNALSGGFCKFSSDIYEVVKDIDFEDNKDIEKIYNLPDDIISELKRTGFILFKDLDEFAFIKSRHLLSRYSDTNSLGLTIVPTTNCNFRCTYCFEADKNYPDCKMTDEVIDSIINLIDLQLKKNGNLDIAWYGGEPLMALDIIKKLQSKILEIVKNKELNFSSAIITNGYFLTAEAADELVRLGINFAQITLDGPKEIHDSKRFLINKEGTFDKIIKNILSANKDLNISLRVNIEKDNINHVEKFMDNLIETGISKMQNVTTYFAVVKDYSLGENSLCNCYSTKEYSVEENYLVELALKKGINISQRINPNVSVCGSLSPKALVIEPDGTIQKCWGIVGEKNSSIGNVVLGHSNEQHYLKNQSDWYSWTGFENEECRKCKVLPLCMGGCPLHSITKVEAEKSGDFKCITMKYNLTETLESMAKKYNLQKNSQAEVKA